MSEDSASQANQRIAQEIQTKFEFWLVGLIFAVLALAVQTASFNGGRLGQLCELAAWIALLVAGLIGVSRLEWTPPIYHMASRKSRHEAVLSQAQEIKIGGHKTIFVADADELQDLDEFLANVKSNIKTLDGHILPLQRRQFSMYRVMRACLILGFVLLLVARGYDPAANLIRSPGAETNPPTQEPTPSPQ